MLIDLLSPLPGQAPVTGSIDRLFTGNYKSNGNLVSLKVDIIDFTDFQRHGCLSNGGCNTLPHSHNISGTLYCHPDSNTVRLNLNLLPPTSWQPATSSESLLPSKEVKSWPAHLQPQTNSHGVKSGYNPLYSGGPGPVSPPTSQDVPPLLDFPSDGLMSDIHNITFDLKDHGLASLYSDSSSLEAVPVSRIVSTQATTLVPLMSEPHHPAHSSHYPCTHVQTKPTTASPISVASHPTLLQPKLERSDSICSEFTPMKEEWSYTDDLAGLDDLDHDNSLTPPTSISSPLLFSPSQNKSPLNNSEKNTIFFNNSHSPVSSKSFENKTNKIVQDNTFSSLSSLTPQLPVTSQSYSNGNTYSRGLTETRKPFTLSQSQNRRESPSSVSSSEASPQETPITLLTSPKSRNRRNSSLDETKPHVCPQCGARFTTKSNLGQHAKIHLAVKPFICEICSHGFTRAAHYESHVAKHKGLKTHRCDQCGESFARLDNLLRHSARHKHGKIFDCATCGKGFHRKDKLLEHEKVHSEYTFPCVKCSKTFHTNDALKHHLPLHEDSSKTQCKICLKFINVKSLSKHMSAFHKESVTNLNESNNNNNINISSAKSKSRSRTNNNASNEKLHGCQYCKKSFVSPAKLRLHTAKYHAEERLHEAQPHLEPNILSAGQAGPGETRLRFYDEPGACQTRYHSPSSDGLPSQQVPEMELSYMNSSPEDISDFGNSKELGMASLPGNSYSIPTIHIPEFDNIQSKMGDNSEISTEAIQALLFS